METFWEGIIKCWSKYGPSYLSGAGRTLLIALVGTAAGCVIGFLAGMVQTIPVRKGDRLIKRLPLRLAKLLCGVYVEVFRGTPMIVQAVFIYYGLRLAFNIGLSMWPAAFIIVSVNTGAYMAETVRGGILSVDPGQSEGAIAVGMTHAQAMTAVILPQAFRSVIPQISNNFIINIKDTSVLSVISITDLFFVHKTVAGTLYLYFESAAIAMVIYLSMTLFFSWLLRRLEGRLDGPANYDLATTDTLAYTAGTLKYRPPETPNPNLDLREADMR